MLLNTGVQARIIAEATAGAGVTERIVNIQSDSALATLSITGITGSLLVEVLGQVGDFDVVLFAFDPQTAPTADLLVKGAGIALPTVLRVRATYTGTCDYEVQLRAVNTSAGTGGGAATDPVILPPTINNISIPLANTEQSFSIPAGTKRIELFERTGSRVRYAFSLGATATVYQTLEPWVWKSLTDLDTAAPITIYFRASKPSSALELTTWS